CRREEARHTSLGPNRAETSHRRRDLAKSLARVRGRVRQGRPVAGYIAAVTLAKHYETALRPATPTLAANAAAIVAARS
ncbi:MAG: hypothetical protein WA446_00385, partial [Steroidobacteraceae bacterium]